MSITQTSLAVLTPYLKGDVFSLGYPDISISKTVLAERWGLELVRVNPSNKSAKRQHSMDEDLPDTEEVFYLLGVTTFRCCDVKTLRGCEIAADLNEPQDFGQYDLVIDPGTLEHCFNIGQAALNAANAVKPGGHIFHGNPLSMVNHGFYMLSPTWYWDWYTDNGWEVKELYVTNQHTMEKLKSPTGRFKVASELSNMALVHRLSDKPMTWPTQTKYKGMLA